MEAYPQMCNWGPQDLACRALQPHACWLDVPLPKGELRILLFFLFICASGVSLYACTWIHVIITRGSLRNKWGVCGAPVTLAKTLWGYKCIELLLIDKTSWTSTMCQPLYMHYSKPHETHAEAILLYPFYSWTLGMSWDKPCSCCCFCACYQRFALDLTDWALTVHWAVSWALCTILQHPWEEVLFPTHFTDKESDPGSR